MTNALWVDGRTMEVDGKDWGAGWVAHLDVTTSRNRWRRGHITIGVGKRHGLPGQSRAFYKTEKAAMRAVKDEVRRLRDYLNYLLGEDAG